MTNKGLLKQTKNIFFVSLMALAVACVPAKQFESLQDDYRKAEEARKDLVNKNEVLDIENTEFKSRLDVLQKEHAALVADSLAKADEIKNLLEERKTLKKRYEDIHTAQEALIKGNANETRRLLKELQKTQEDLQAREDRLRELENQLNQKKLSLDALRLELEEQKDLLEKKNQQIEARNARLIELESVLHRKDSIVANLKSRVQNALLGFQNMGLSVSTKNGKVYVSLAEKLLFTSGSTVVDKKGVQALKELAGVLEQNPDINIMIEGHTDDVPMNPNSALKDNWGLSVARATSIVRILIDNSKIDPKRITACGRGEFVPIDPAKTKEARKKNRRTEIILTPKLDEILEILGSN